MRLGVAGLTHGHVWGLIDSWEQAADVELAAVADRTPLLERAKARFARCYSDWPDMLDKEVLDALLVTSDNVESAEICVEALGRGLPCMVEKPMAANARDADRMLEAQASSGALLMINWPTAWRPAYLALAAEIQKGTIGRPFHCRTRMGHYGPREIGCDEWFVGWLYDERLNGGGASADFCGYGAVLCRWLFGAPSSVSCVRGNYTKDYEVCDDHALMTLTYPRMSAAIEGTWATKGFDSGPGVVVHGEEGTLAIYEEKRLLLHRPGNAEELATADSGPTLRDGTRAVSAGPARYFLDRLASGDEPEGMLSPLISADAVRIVEAGLRASDSGCAESIYAQNVT